MMQMDAMVVVAHGGPEQLQHQQIKAPVPGPGQVRLKLSASSVNFADILARRAPYRHFVAPFVPGFDGVGTIDQVGEGVDGVDLGQRVAAYVKGGSYAEYALADAEVCYPLSESVSDEDAIGIGISITAYNALHWAGRLQHGERVLIHAGAGGVGSTAIQLAQLHGASQIIATVGHAAKRETCLAAGAHHVLLTQPGFGNELQTLTQGKGVDVILDTIGGSILEEGMEHLAEFGRLVSFGHSSSADAHITSRPLHRHNRAVIGYSSGGYRKHKPHLLRATANTIIEMWEQQSLYTLVGETFALHEAAKAHAAFERRDNVGKLLLRI